MHQCLSHSCKNNPENIAHSSFSSSFTYLPLPSPLWRCLLLPDQFWLTISVADIDITKTFTEVPREKHTFYEQKFTETQLQIKTAKSEPKNTEKAFHYVDLIRY